MNIKQNVDENHEEVIHQINLFLFDDFYSLNEKYFIRRIKKIQKIYKIRVVKGLFRSKPRNEVLNPIDIIKEFKDIYDIENYIGHTFFITNGKIEENYYRKIFRENWNQSYGSVMSFYQLDEFVDNWGLLNEYISRFLIVQIFKNTIKHNIKIILQNYGLESLSLFHRKDSGRCIYNFAKEKKIAAFEVNDPKICNHCKNKIKKITNNVEIDKSIRFQIKKEFDLFNEIIFKLKNPSLGSYLKEKLFHNPIGNFIFSGLLFGTIINIIFYYLERHFEFLINPLITFLLLMVFIIPLGIIITYFFKKKSY